LLVADADEALVKTIIELSTLPEPFRPSPIKVMVLVEESPEIELPVMAHGPELSVTAAPLVVFL